MSLATTLIVKEAGKLDREQFEIPKKKKDWREAIQNPSVE
jgi:hypothetical protein